MDMSAKYACTRRATPAAERAKTLGAPRGATPTYERSPRSSSLGSLTEAASDAARAERGRPPTEMPRHLRGGGFMGNGVPAAAVSSSDDLEGCHVKSKKL